MTEKELQILRYVDSRLAKVIMLASKIVPFLVVEGHRDEARQNQLFIEKKSKLQFPKSKHNGFPSEAVDIVPLKNGKADWNDHCQFCFVAGVIQAVANQSGVKVRWGGDFNGDLNVNNDSFIDRPHFELVV